METFSEVTPFRRCANSKSRRHPDVQCTSLAVDGDYCTRHCKRPHRYVASVESHSPYITRTYTHMATKLQKWWRTLSPLMNLRNQGFARYNRTLSQNSTEVYSMDSIEKIPPMYFFSYTDSKHHIWTFDLRSLSQILSQNVTPVNPYTREDIPLKTLTLIRKRIFLLRKHKYPLVYMQGEQLSVEQIWNQQVLDIFMKIETLGYSCVCQWYHEFTVEDHVSLYRMLYQLWNWRLGLTNVDRESIVPGYSAQQTKLFKWGPDSIERERHALKWWKKHNLFLIQQFITRSTDKTKQSLGALYVIMGLVSVSDAAAEAYPWIAETLDGE